jgi:hypothetical protein
LGLYFHFISEASVHVPKISLHTLIS